MFRRCKLFPGILGKLKERDTAGVMWTWFLLQSTHLSVAQCVARFLVMVCEQSRASEECAPSAPLIRMNWCVQPLHFSDTKQSNK